MTFSEKAQEIHDHMVDNGTADTWIGRAKGHITRKPQYQAGPPYTYDRPGLRTRLKGELSGAVSDATDDHRDEIVEWLFDEAQPG